MDVMTLIIVQGWAFALPSEQETMVLQENNNRSHSYISRPAKALKGLSSDGVLEDNLDNGWKVPAVAVG
jgi:hypothetical protein